MSSAAGPGSGEDDSVEKFLICGVTGPFEEGINGHFIRSDEMMNGHAVFEKVVDPGEEKIYVWHAPNGQWMVSRSVHKEKNRSGGWAHTMEEGLAWPGDSNQWSVSEDSKWRVQPEFSLLTDSDIAAKLALEEEELERLQTFEVRGGIGSEERVNGVFAKVDEVVNGKPCFQKVIDDGEKDVRIWRGEDEFWYLGPNENLESGRYACTVTGGPGRGITHPAIVGEQWKVWNPLNKGYVPSNTVETVMML